MLWSAGFSGTLEFAGGKENWVAAACIAQECSSFVPDVEEEMVADDERSCYNCRYRRWSAHSFTCQRPASF